jgi:hypothetical protein
VNYEIKEINPALEVYLHNDFQHPKIENKNPVFKIYRPENKKKKEERSLYII